MKSFFEKFYLFLLGLVLFACCLVYVTAVGNEMTYTKVGGYQEKTGGEVRFEVGSESDGYIEVADAGKDSHGNPKAVLKGKKPGKVYLYCYEGNQIVSIDIFFVHKTKVITYDDYFGEYNGAFYVNLVMAIYMIVVIFHYIRKMRKNFKKNMYSYVNILYIGLILFLFTTLIALIVSTVSKEGLYMVLDGISSSMNMLVVLTLPVVVIVSLILMFSNITLMKMEGKNIRNMLGFLLSFAMGAGVILSIFAENFFWNSGVIDSHRWTGIGRFVAMFFTNTIYAVYAYAEFLLVGTFIVFFIAARHIPKFDKDYIIIHGCMIRKDGTPTKLLASRADRAITFSKLQKENTGKDIYFIPSGGQGGDETISEAECIKNYLVSKGVDEKFIIMEDKSDNTETNLKYSFEIIKEREGAADAKVAFATTNYHVFRAGMLAGGMGMDAEGIGAATKSYFWINAAIREFVATIFSEKKRHLKMLCVIVLFNLCAMVLMYFSNVVLSF
ncbi:MAG: YdcF family protein [Lachnospiraceae bacterium]|nr:YdcF family protein [Lachnospiraceae bacterium]